MQTAIQLGKNVFIDASSAEAFKCINSLLHPNVVIILDSCSTASEENPKYVNIAQLISRWCPGHNVWASKELCAPVNWKVNSIKPYDMEIMKEGRNVCVVYRDGVLKAKH